MRTRVTWRHGWVEKVGILAQSTHTHDITLGGLLAPLLPVLASTVAGLVLILAEGPIFLSLIGLALVGIGFLSTDMATLKRALVAIMLFEIPIQIDIYLGHDEALADAGTLSGFNLSITTFVLVLLYALWLAEAAAPVTRRWRPAYRAALPAATYLGATVVSSFVARDPVISMYEIALIVQALLILVYMVHYIRDRADLLFVLTFLVGGVLIQSLVVLLLSRLGGSQALGVVSGRVSGSRIGGTVGSPNGLGAYLTLLLGPTLGLAMAAVHRSLRILSGIAFVLGSLSLILTFSRGAWVGFTVAFVVVLAVSFNKGWLKPTAALTIGLPFVLLLLLQADPIIQRLAEFDNPAAQARIPLMELAFRMIGDRPFIGVGANNFAISLNDYLTVDFSQAWIFTVHNKYLLVWVEAGIVALLAFLWFLGSALRRAARLVAFDDPVVSPLGLGLLVGILGNMVHMTVDIFHARPQVQVLWLVVGIVIALEALAPRWHAPEAVLRAEPSAHGPLR